MLASIILLTLNVLGTLYLETTLRSYYRLELLLVGALIMFGVVLISAEMQKMRWTWKASTIYYSLSVLNLTFLFLISGSFLAFGMTTLVSLVGLLRSVGRIDHLKEMPMPPVRLETYGKEQHADQPLMVDPVMWVHPDDLVNGEVRPSRVSNSRRTSARKVSKKSPAKSARKTVRKSSQKKTTQKRSARSGSRKKASRKKTSSTSRRKARKSSNRR